MKRRSRHNKGFDDPRTLQKSKTTMRMRYGVMHNSQIGMNKLVYDKDYLYEQHTIQCKTINKIAKELKVDFATVRKYLNLHDIKQGFDPYSTKNMKQIIKYRETNTDQAIADEIGITKSALHYRLKAIGIDPRTPNIPVTSTKLLNNRQWLREQYIVKKRASTDIAKELDCTYQTVINYLRKHKLRVKGRLSKRIHKLLANKEYMHNLYINEGLNTRKISTILGIRNDGKGVVAKYLKLHGIPLRANFNKKQNENK